MIYEKALVDALTEANSIATNVAIQSVLIQDVIDAVSGTSIERVDDGKSATNESAAAFASRLDNLLNVSIPAIEEERWVREEIEAETFSSFSDFETKLESILNGLSGRTVFDPASLTISPSALLVTTNTSISIIEAYFNSASGTYPLYDDGSVVETLSPVGTWILVNPSGSSWETANDAVGSFGFERVFSFPDGSNQFFDSDRNTTTEVAVIVSTIRISDGFDDVILTKDTATNNATLDIAFTVADDDTTIAGADKDSVDTKNGLLEFSVAAPSGYDNAVISTTINGTLTTQSGIKVGDEFTFDLPIARSSGSDWVSLTNGAIFSIIIEFYDGTDGPYLPHTLNLEIDRSNEERLMSSINAATTTDSLINLLDSARKNSVDSSSIGNSIIYNSLLANLNANSSNGTEINSLTAFDTLLSAIIAFEETLEDAVDYESSLSRTTSFTSDFYTKLIDNITSALISTDIRRVYGNTTDASVLISDLETLKTNLESIEVSQWIIEELKDNHTPSTYPEIVTALKAVYVTLKDASIYTPSNIVLSPSSIMIAPGTIEADVRTLLNTDANYPQYSESGNTFTLDEITGEDWNLVEIDNNSAGSYTYQRVFKLPPDSDFFANSDRDLEVTVTAIVSTVTTEPLISEVTGQKRADANVFDFDLTFLVDDSDSKTIRGSAVDRVELDNGELTLIVAAPSSAASARVNITFRNKSPITNASYSLSGNAIYIAIEYANKDGSVWKLPSSNETYDLSVEWLDGSNNILMTQSLSGTLSQNTTPFIDELNDASNGSSLKALLEENFVNQVSSSSITESAFYDLLIDNLDTDQFDTYASFNTLLVELLNFEETSLASVNYANNLSGSDSSFDNTLVGDVLNALDGTSIEKVYSGGTVDASTLITRLNSLNTTLSSINPSTWVIEDIISTQAYDDFETLESRLLTIAEALEGKVIYDSDNLKISPSALTVVTGTELQVVIDALNEELNNYPRYEETGFTDVILSQVSNWVFTRPGFTWDDVKNTPSIETFEATYEFPESSRLYFDVSRTREITITVEVTIE